MSQKILVEISARHIHLSLEDKNKLLGTELVLRKIKDLSQPGLFACAETVDLQIGEKKLEKVRIIGPLRPRTQIEISQTDARFLKIKVPFRISGDTENSQGCTIIGPKGVVNLREGLIIARRHLHLAPAEALKFGLKNGQEVSLKIDGERSLTFHKVITRIGSDYQAAAHLDTDEGNAAGVEARGEGEIII